MADLGDLINQLSGASSGLAPPIVGQEQQPPSPLPQSRMDPLIQQLTGAASAPAPAKPPMPMPKTTEAPPTSLSAGPRGYLDALAGGAQGTSPQTTNISGQSNYQLAPPEEQWKYLELGVPSDQQKYVALGGKVYNRNPEMAEGPLSGFGRALSLGVPETGIPIGAGARTVPNASQSLLQDFGQLGVTPNVPAVGQNRISGLVSQIMNNVPFSSSVVRKGVGQTLSDTSGAAERIAGNYGAAATPEEGGTALQNALGLFVKQTFPQKAGQLFDEFNNQMAGVGQVPLTNTIKAIGAPLDRFPSSPELGQMLTSPKLQAFSGVLGPNGTLTFPELQELRSSVGRMISDPMLINDIPRADLKRVYGGISSDLESAASNQSPEALNAFQKANQFYSAGMKRVDALEPLLTGSAEQSLNKINSAAGSTAGANAALLRAAQRSMPPEDWNNVGAAVIRRMGEPTPGAQNVLSGNNFSAGSFTTNWNKLSDAAKDTLFGANVPGSNRSDLEALARVSQAQKNVQGLANTSHSAEHVILGGGGMGIAASLFEHPDAMLSHIGGAVGGAAGAHLTAKALMSPGFARWLYQMPGAYAMAPAPAVGAQRVLGGLENVIRNNPELEPIRGAVMAGSPQPVQ